MVYDLYAGLSYCDVIFDVVRNVQTVSAERSSTGAMYTLTFAGAVMFFMLWEAGKRYNICFTGVCLLLMAEGADGFSEYCF